MGKNKFEQTKAEQDMRASSREMDEWLKSQNKEAKNTKPVATSAPAPVKESSTKNPVVTLSKSKYFGETMDKFIEIQRKQGIHVDDGMRFSAGPQERIDAKEPTKEEIKPKKEDSGPDIGDLGNWLGKNVMKGIGKFNKGLMATADLIMPDILGENDIFRNLNEYYSDLDKYWESESEKAAENMGGKGWNIFGEILSSTVSAVPGMIMGGMLSGINTAGALGSSAVGAASVTAPSNFLRDLPKDTISVTKQLVKNPQVGISFVENIGTNYENEISKGATPLEAMASSTMTTFLNAGIDQVSPEIFEMVMRNKGYSKLAQNIGKLADGGLTGVIQGSVEPSVSNAIHNDADLFSMEDENAVFNPSRMINDFATGVATKSVDMAFDSSSDKSGDLTAHKNNNTKKSTPKAESKPFNARMNEVRKRLNQQFLSNSSLYGEEKAFEILTTEWNDYVNRLSDEDFDEYIKIMKGE